MPQSGQEAADQTENTLAHCSYFYLFWNKVLFIVVTGDISWSSVCVLVGCRGWACWAEGSPDWCWEVTAFMFRHTLQGTLLSLPSVSLHKCYTHTHTLFEMCLINHKPRKRERTGIHTQQDWGWLLAEGADLAVNQHQPRQMFQTCCFSRQETNLHK